MAAAPHDRMTIKIEVARNDNPNPNSEKKGTFKQPWPLVKVQPGTPVEWKIQGGDPKDTFLVTFNTDGTPLQDATGRPVQSVSDATGPLAAAGSGSARTYHYEVYLTDGVTGEVHGIDGCPAMRV